MACGGGDGGSSPIEETATAGQSELTYDPTTAIYTYVWKTDKRWSGTCRLLTIRLHDGTEHSALFKFNGKGGRSAGGSEETMAGPIFLPLVSR